MIARRGRPARLRLRRTPGKETEGAAEKSSPDYLFSPLSLLPSVLLTSKIVKFLTKLSSGESLKLLQRCILCLQESGRDLAALYCQTVNMRAVRALFLNRR